MTGVIYLHKCTTPASRGIVEAFASSLNVWRQSGDEIFQTLSKEVTDKRIERSTVLISTEDMSAHKIFALHNGKMTSARRSPALLADHLRESECL
jgi:hypothetical protein